MLWNFLICCILVQLIFVNSIEVHEDVIEDLPNSTENSKNQDNLVNATMVDGSREINSTEIVSNNVTLVTTNLTRNGYDDDESLRNISKPNDERESFQKKGSIEVLQKEGDKIQKNSTVSVKFEGTIDRYSIDESDNFQKEASDKILQKDDKKIQENSIEIKPQTLSYSTNPHSIKKALVSEPNVINTHFSQPIFTPSPIIENDFKIKKILSAHRSGSIKKVKEYSPEIISEKFSKTSEQFLSVPIRSSLKLSVPEKGHSTEIKPQVFSQPFETRIDKERFIPVQIHTVVGKDFSQPIFIPSPEIKVNNFGSAVLSDKDSFQPVRYPLISLNKKELLTPTRRVSFDYQDNPRPKETKNGGINFPIKSEIFKGDVIKEVQPKRRVSQVKRRNEQGYWVVLDNSGEEPKLKPKNKIMNFDQHAPLYDQDDYRSFDVKPVHEEVRGDHPYPFEFVKDGDSLNWLHSSPPPLEGAEYEDHSYDDIPSPPPSPSRPHSWANTHPDWESKFTRGKEIVKPSPLRSILHVLGTIVPIGLLLSALTPNVVLINPNATSTSKQTPVDLNLFRGRQRSLKEDETIGRTNLDEVIIKLAGVKGQKPRSDSVCDKKLICQHLALHGAALDDLQKTIENILDQSQPAESAVNVSMEELFAAAREDSCSSLFVCKQTATAATSD